MRPCLQVEAADAGERDRFDMLLVAADAAGGRRRGVARSRPARSPGTRSAGRSSRRRRRSRRSRGRRARSGQGFPPAPLREVQPPANGRKPPQYQRTPGAHAARTGRDHRRGLADRAPLGVPPAPPRHPSPRATSPDHSASGSTFSSSCRPAIWRAASVMRGKDPAGCRPALAEHHVDPRRPGAPVRRGEGDGRALETAAVRR